jgi:hypothetical protein
MKHRRMRSHTVILVCCLLAVITVGYSALTVWCTEKDAYFQEAEEYPVKKLRFLKTGELVELTLHTSYTINSSYAPETPKEYYDIWKKRCRPLQELALREDAAQELYKAYLKEEVVTESYPRELEKISIIDGNFEQSGRWWLRRGRLYSLELLLSQNCYRNKLNEEQQKVITQRIHKNRKRKKEWSKKNPDNAYSETVNWWERNPEESLYS